MDIELRQSKVRVKRSESDKVQRFMFSYGFSWREGQEIKVIPEIFEYVNFYLCQGKTILVDFTEEKFNKDSSKELKWKKGKLKKPKKKSI